MKTVLALLSLTFSGIAFAKNPATICRMTTKFIVVIQPQKKLVVQYGWGEPYATDRIVESKVRLIEIRGGLWQTTYTLDSKVKIVIEYAAKGPGKEWGSGYIVNLDGSTTPLIDCSEAPDFKR